MVLITSKREITTISDEDLVGLLKNKNEDVRAIQGELYDRFIQRVYFKCFSIVKSKNESHDLAHDIFIKIFSNLHLFKGDSKLSLWIHSITYNTCMTYLRERKKKRIFEFSDDVDEEIDSPVEVDDSLIKELRLNRLEEQMGKLDPEERILLLMKYTDGMSIEQISLSLKLKTSAVKMRLFRARKKLLIALSTIQP